MVKNNHLEGGAKKHKKNHHHHNSIIYKEKLEKLASKIHKNKQDINNFITGKKESLPSHLINSLQEQGYNINNINELDSAIKSENIDSIVRSKHVKKEHVDAANRLMEIQRKTGRKTGKGSRKQNGLREVAHYLKNQISKGNRNLTNRNQYILDYANHESNKNSSPAIMKTIIMRSNDKGAFVEISAETGQEVLHKNKNKSGKVEYIFVEKNKHNTETKTHKDLFTMKKDYAEYLKSNTFDGDERYYNEKNSFTNIVKDYPFYYKNNETYAVLSLLASINIPKEKQKSNDEYKQTQILTYKKNFRKKLLKAIPELTEDKIDELAGIDDNLERDELYRGDFPGINLEDDIRYWNRELIVLKLFFFFLDNTNKNNNDFNKTNLDEIINAVYSKDKDLFNDLFNFFSTEKENFSNENLNELKEFISNSNYIREFLILRGLLIGDLQKTGLSNVKNTFNELNYNENNENKINMTKEAKDLIRKKLNIIVEEYKKYIKNKEVKRRVEKGEGVNIQSYEETKKQGELHKKEMEEKEAERKEEAEAELEAEAERKRIEVEEERKRIEKIPENKNHLSLLKNEEGRKLKSLISKLPEELKVLGELKKNEKGKSKDFTLKELSTELKQLQNMNALRKFIGSKLTPQQQTNINKKFFTALKNELEKEGTINKTFKRFEGLILEDNLIKQLKKLKNKNISLIKEDLQKSLKNNGINKKKFGELQSTNAFINLR